MQHKDFGDLQCPIARSLERVGEWWSILILRDAFQGLTRFDQFQKDLGIAPNMLTRRLNTLVDSGLLERRLYNERPPRHEYVLTQRGRDFRTVLWALVAWGSKHFSPEGETVVVVDAKTGERADPVLVDSRSGRPLRAPEFMITAGPAANERTRRRYARANSALEAGDEPPFHSTPKRGDEPQFHSVAKVSGAKAGGEPQLFRSVPKNRPAKQKKAGTSS
jgi:DNA-binding HxlR family transcriptional regulator